MTPLHTHLIVILRDLRILLACMGLWWTALAILLTGILLLEASQKNSVGMEEVRRPIRKNLLPHFVASAIVCWLTFWITGR